MSAPLTRCRRIGVAIVALSLAACIFRAQIADALVVRGDDFMYRSDAGGAMNRYERALAIDPSDEAAVDRIVFLAMQMRTRESLHRGIAVADAYLHFHRNDGGILADRALCYLILRRYRQALNDFARAATLQRDPRYFVFAGWAAQHAGESKRARTLWGKALTIDPHYVPARTALEHAR
jgi:tetratricopeptide (TPR) repeat protein